jgi:hypothetical protein
LIIDKHDDEISKFIEAAIESKVETEDVELNRRERVISIDEQRMQELETLSDITNAPELMKRADSPQSTLSTNNPDVEHEYEKSKTFDG